MRKFLGCFKIRKTSNYFMITPVKVIFLKKMATADSAFFFKALIRALSQILSVVAFLTDVQDLQSVVRAFLF